MSKIITTILALFTLIGGLYAADQHYAKASELEKKADAAAVVSLQKEILRDRKEEVEYELFVLERTDQRTDLENYRIEKLRSRLRELEEIISE